MSDVQTEQPEDTEPKPRPDSLPADQEWDRVEMDPKVQGRFNRVYATMQATKNALDVAAKDNKALADRLEKMERDGIESRKAEEKARLKEEKKAALEAEDHDKVVDIDDRLMDLKTVPKEEPKPVIQESAPVWFTPEKEQALTNWASSMAEDGQLKRPWAQEGHPKNARCVEIVNAVINDPDFMGSDMPEILAEVDRLMAPRAPKTAAVLTGGGVSRTPKATITLSEEQKMVARRMYDTLPPADAYKQYAAAVQRNAK